MKRIMEFKVFESIENLTDEQKEFLDRGTKSTWKANSEGKIDIDGSFDCHSFDLEDFKGIQFGHVSGDFDCSNNSIQKLEGAPASVNGNFYCDSNKLRTLEGAPTSVGRGFYCSNNKLQTLEGAPTSVGGNFGCSHNSLQTLKGAPESVGGRFYCYYNSLQTLEGAPESIGGEFHSDKINIPKGRWGFPEFLRILKDGDLEQKKLIGTLVSPEAINKELEKDPEGMMINLKSIWNSSEFSEIRSQLKIPKYLEGEMDLLGDLDGIGL